MFRNIRWKFLIVLLLTACCAANAQRQARHGHSAKDGVWTFAVSGDSRNCGDVVMPAIAAGARQNHAAFYWHLGDLRAIYTPDEDYLHEAEHRGQAGEKQQYWNDAWDDFIQNQLVPFGEMPVFLGIGNHETYEPKTRNEFLLQFADWLNSPILQKQRLADDPKAHKLKAYYHWIQGGVDFLYLDNATPDQFDAGQMSWLEGVLHRAAANPQVRTLVVGMHKALPDSLAAGHAMNDSAIGTQSGRQVYADLWNFKQQTRKPVYVLASHSHFYMGGIFDSDYWRTHGGVLPGWIVGTGGAMRYPLPPAANRAQDARQKVYGYLLGRVHPNGATDFTFEEVRRMEIPGTVAQRYTPEFVDYCFNENSDFK